MVVIVCSTPAVFQRSGVRCTRRWSLQEEQRGLVVVGNRLAKILPDQIAIRERHLRSIDTSTKRRCLPCVFNCRTVSWLRYIQRVYQKDIEELRIKSWHKLSASLLLLCIYATHVARFTSNAQFTHIAVMPLLQSSQDHLQCNTLPARFL